MIDTQTYLTAARLNNAYNGSRGATIAHVDRVGHTAALRAVAEMAIAEYIASSECVSPHTKLAESIDRLARVIQERP